MAKASVTRQVAAVLSAIFGFCLVFILIRQHDFRLTNQDFDPTVAKIGTQMMGTESNGFALPLEVVSMLLLAAMIGCIVIAIKAKE